MSLCLASAALAMGLALPDARFTLRWTHSVERTEWVERWRVDGQTLVLDEASVRGSGAGMEPPDGSVLRDGWWVYQADRRLPALRLAASGATGRGWQLCTTAGGCQDLESLLSLAGQRPAQVLVRADAHCRPLP
jgi:hypothetical protein